MHDADLRRSAFGKTRNDSVSVVIIEWTESKNEKNFKVWLSPYINQETFWKM